MKIEIGKVIDWSKLDKDDYLLAMERSPIKDVEIKVLLKGALTDDINSREVYMKGITTVTIMKGIQPLRLKNYKKHFQYFD